MFVSESNIFGPSSMKLRISSMEGTDIVVDISPELSVDKLKILAVGQIYDPSESAKLSLYHKLLHVDSGRILDEEKSVTQEGIQENGKKYIWLF